MTDPKVIIDAEFEDIESCPLDEAMRDVEDTLIDFGLKDQAKELKERIFPQVKSAVEKGGDLLEAGERTKTRLGKWAERFGPAFEPRGERLPRGGK